MTPSSKARGVGYRKIDGFTTSLYRMGVKSAEDVFDTKNIGHFVIKNFVMKHTPQGKCGGPKNGMYI